MTDIFPTHSRILDRIEKYFDSYLTKKEIKEIQNKIGVTRTQFRGLNEDIKEKTSFNWKPERDYEVYERKIETFKKSKEEPTKWNLIEIIDSAYIKNYPDNKAHKVYDLTFNYENKTISLNCFI